MKCTAHKTNGERCNAPAISGAMVCRVHGGSAPQVKRSAKMRLLELVDPALATLGRAVSSTRKGIPTAVEISAAKDILDRAGFKPIGKHDVSVRLMEVFKNGDLSQLEDDELEQITHFIELVAFGEDRARMLAEKRRVLIEAGAAPDVIEAMFEEPAPVVREEHTTRSTKTDDEREGW